MIDHTGVVVTDYPKSKAFHIAALTSIGYALLAEIPASVTGHTLAGFGEAPKPDFWISAGSANRPPLHVAFRVATRAMVHAFYEAALAAGGRDNGAPGLRPTTTARLCRTRMATTSRPCAIAQSENPPSQQTAYGGHMDRAHGAGLPLRAGAAHVRLRPAVLSTGMPWR